MNKLRALERQRERRLLNNNATTKKYERTKNGFLVRKYRNMLSRISGVQKLKNHLYLGKELLDKEAFYKWAYDSHEFHLMFKVYEDSNYERKLCPTVDRIDSSKGYTIENMQWLTHSENSRKSSIVRKSNKIVETL